MKIIFIFLFVFPYISICCQSTFEAQFFYNKVFDLIISNQNRLEHTILITKFDYRQTMSGGKTSHLELKNFKIDTSHIIKYDYRFMISSQHNLIQVPNNIFNDITLKSEPYSKLFISDAVRVVVNGVEAYLTFFKTECVNTGLDDNLILQGFTLFYGNSSQKFYKLEYFDDQVNFPYDYNIKIIDPK